MRILIKIRHCLAGTVAAVYIWYLRRIIGIAEIGTNCYISRKSRLDRINPMGIHIGNNVWILARVSILTHDHTRSLVKPEINKSHTHIGDNSVIGIRSLIMPAVTVGRECVVAAGSVVTADIPDRCMAAGNPARIIRCNIHINNNGQIIDYGQKI